MHGCRLGAHARLRRLEKLLALERSLDTVVWQLLASVICPGYTIHTVVALAHAALLPLEVSNCRFILIATIPPTLLPCAAGATLAALTCWASSQYGVPCRERPGCLVNHPACVCRICPKVLGPVGKGGL